jgi:hypothetical protein
MTRFVVTSYTHVENIIVNEELIINNTKIVATLMSKLQM